jgi:hypothetical protein
MIDPKKLYAETLRRLAEPFFAQGEKRVFVMRCCGRVFVGARPADSCKTCQTPPTNTECSSIEAVLTLADNP